jgi:hypothetical protein
MRFLVCSTFALMLLSTSVLAGAAKTPAKPPPPPDAFPPKTIEDGGYIFNEAMTKTLKTSVAKLSNVTKCSIAFVGVGLPNKDIQVKAPNGWTTLSKDGSNLTGAAAAPRGLLVNLPEFLAKEKPEIVVIFTDSAPGRKLSDSEQYDWEDVARLCFRMGALPVFAVSASADEKAEKDVRSSALQAASDAGIPLICLRAASQFPKRLAEILIGVEKYVFGRNPTAPAAGPTAVEE